MALRKNITDIQNRYPLYLEIGLIVALSCLIVATRLNFSTGQSFQVYMQEQETVEIEQIQQTKQETEPPPPPRPPVPVEVPNTEAVDQQFDFDASIDLSESITPTEPPSAHEEEQVEESEEPEQEIFVAVEQQPQLIGGMKALQDSVEYPELARRAGVEGRVIVQFVVDENGNVQDPRILQGAHSLLDKEALRVIKQQKFQPGRQRNKPVKVRMALPVTFKLQN